MSGKGAIARRHARRHGYAYPADSARLNGLGKGSMVFVPPSGGPRVGQKHCLERCSSCTVLVEEANGCILRIDREALARIVAAIPIEIAETRLAQADAGIPDTVLKSPTKFQLEALLGCHIRDETDPRTVVLGVTWASLKQWLTWIKAEETAAWYCLGRGQ